MIFFSKTILIILIVVILCHAGGPFIFTGITEPLYIHPDSVLYQRDPSAVHPDYIVYSQLVKNQAGDMTYMTCVTEIKASWVAELARDCPLLQVT